MKIEVKQLAAPFLAMMLLSGAASISGAKPKSDSPKSQTACSECEKANSAAKAACKKLAGDAKSNCEKQAKKDLKKCKKTCKK